MKSKKYDTGKNRLDLIPPEVILELGKVLSYGAEKYSSGGWKNLDDFENRYYGALLRHLMAWRGGEKVDPESGLNHLSHVLTNVVFLVWKETSGHIKTTN